MLEHLSLYEITNLALWQGRKDTLPLERFFQRVECVDLRSHVFDKKAAKTVIVGFCSDEGIKRNEGRLGAKFGPDTLREQFAKLACHGHDYFLDAGNIICEDEDLEEAQVQLAQVIEYCHLNGYKTIVLGGGHETAWGHFNGLTSSYANIGIINFDAHFDIRSPTYDLGTSGTPFAQIKAYCEANHRLFNYCCIGIQKNANTHALFEKAHAWNVSYLLAESLYEKNPTQHYAFLDQFMQQHNHLYVSICLDVFAESIAPGVSAPQALGLTPSTVIPLLKYILQTGKVISLDIVELSPPLDFGHQTARLAANLLAQILPI